MNRALVHALLSGMAAAARLPKVFPGYIARQIKLGLLSAETGVLQPNRDFPGATVGDMETIGDCRYQIIVTDSNGERTRVTVEPIGRADQEKKAAQ